MVKGLDTFKDYFENYTDHYIIIGGTAMDASLSRARFNPRTTKDIDIILIVEALNKEFGDVFWQFIKDGAYNTCEIDTERTCYRFTDPVIDDFPKQIELFSRKPDGIQLPAEAHLTPIPLDEGLSSLSAILLNESFYQFTIENCTLIDGVNYANYASLICLKAYAYLSNKALKDAGINIQSINIEKHKNDIFRIAYLLTDADTIELPAEIKTHLQEFVNQVKDQLPAPQTFNENFGKGTNTQALLEQIVTTFQLEL